MIFALMINKKGIKFKSLWRTLFVITIAVPQFVSLLLMNQMLQSNGAVNILLSNITNSHVEIQWLNQDATLARWVVIIINCWVGIPYTILSMSGILMNIPEDLYESARIDGAGPVKTFTAITLPYMLLLQLLSSLPSLSATSITLMLFTCCQTVIRRPKNIIRPVKPISLLHGSLS